LCRVGVPKPLEVVAEVNEEDIPRVIVDQQVLLRTDAFPNQRLEGKVREITPMGDPLAKTYRIRIDLPDDTPLKPGMSVEANVITHEKPNALLVPADGVQGSAVFVVNGDRVHKRDIKAGIRGTRSVEILDGLKETDHVVAPIPPAGLKDGQRVRASERRPT
jgi:membrane fusion protein (multidrug efflux system)